MVEAKNKKISSKYVYGSVAYDLEPVVQPQIEIQRKIKKNNKHKNAIKLSLMARIIIVSVLSFMLVYRFTMVMKLTYDIRDLKTQIVQINNDNENVKIDLAEKNNIMGIEKIAVEKCGMIIPEPSQIKYISVRPLTKSSDKYSASAFQMIQRLLGLIY